MAHGSPLGALRGHSRARNVRPGRMVTGNPGARRPAGQGARGRQVARLGEDARPPGCAQVSGGSTPGRAPAGGATARQRRRPGSNECRHSPLRYGERRRHVGGDAAGSADGREGQGIRRGVLGFPGSDERRRPRGGPEHGDQRDDEDGAPARAAPRRAHDHRRKEPARPAASDYRQPPPGNPEGVQGAGGNAGDVGRNDPARGPGASTRPASGVPSPAYPPTAAVPSPPGGAVGPAPDTPPGRLGGPMHGVAGVGMPAWRFRGPADSCRRTPRWPGAYRRPQTAAA